jgi:mRNA interferase MazF
MEKDFDAWNGVKKELDTKVVQRDLYFNEREVWWCAVGLNIDVEVDGKNHNFERPVLILKKFNGHMFWGATLVGGHRNALFYHPVGLKIETSVALSQLKVMSTKRLLRKIEMISEFEFDTIKSKIRAFLF